jgi:hypothetical protein
MKQTNTRFPSSAGCCDNKFAEEPYARYGNPTVSEVSRFVHCVVGLPEIFVVPVTQELESQNMSTLFPEIVDGVVT